MGVDTRVSGCAGEVLAVSVGDMFSCLGVSEPLGKTEVNDVDEVLLLANADQEIVRLDVSVQKVSRVDKLKSLEHLVGQHQHCLQREAALAVVEQVFQ